MQVEIFSDVACPWCAIGKRRFEAALEEFEARDEVEVRWRSFELDPGAPRTKEGSYVQLLADKYGTSRGEAQEMIDRMTATAAEDGWRFRFDRIRPGSTFDAHRLLHLAAETSQQGALKERLLAAYLEEGAAIGEPEVLAGLATEVGLDEGAVAGVLHGEAHAGAVRADERDASRLGIRGVPFFVLDRRLALSGAQPVATIVEALRRVHRESAAASTPAHASAATGANPPGHGHEHDASCADGSCAL